MRFSEAGQARATIRSVLNMLLAWHKYGGGKELLEKLYASIGANVVSFPYGPMPTQPLGWYKKPVAKVEDLQGLKFRTVGISIDVFQAMGAAVNALPGGEIVSAMDRGLLDAAEFNNATSDRLLGFADVSKVCMLVKDQKMPAVASRPISSVVQTVSQ